MKRLFRFLAISCLFVFLCFGSFSHSATFEDAVSKYRSSEFSEALADFKKLLDQDPGNVALLTNSALTAYQLGQKGLALGLLYKAQKIDPHHQQSHQALEFIKSQLNPKELPRQLPFREQLNSALLKHLTFSQWLSLTILSIFAALWAGLSFWGRRHRAIKEGLEFSGLRMIEGTLIFVGILGAILITAKKIEDLQVRGILISQKVPVYSAPNFNSVNLLELYEGFEVLFLRQQDSWFQIKYPGSVTGWVEAKDVFWIDSTKGQN